MVFLHYIGDFALQNQFIAEAKNHTKPIPNFSWYHALAAHSIIHGGLIGILTGSIVLAVLETVVHAAIDYLKSDGRFGVDVDQALHIMCKVLWCVVLIWIPSISNL